MSKTILHDLLQSRMRPSHAVALKYKESGKWIDRTWQEHFSDIESLACYFLSLGIEPGDRIAIVANTSREWCVADLAIMGAGAITVPIYQNSQREEVEHILKATTPKVILLDRPQAAEAIKDLQFSGKAPHLLMMRGTGHESAPPFWQAVDEGSLLKEKFGPRFADLCQGSLPNQVATILFTSGTTGLPKGVVLTHKQVISEVHDAFRMLGVRSDDVSLSFLPYAHVLGRVEMWGHLHVGFTMAMAESIEKLKNHFGEIKPTILMTVPRIFEKIYEGIWQAAGAHPLQMRLFKWAAEVGVEYGRVKQKRGLPSPLLAAQYLVADRLALKTIREKMGGRVRFAVCGGAPLRKDIAEFFLGAGILILEGYGMTETTAAIAVNMPFDYSLGTVGKPIGDVEIRLAEDGEILVRSNKVLHEYYKDPDSTFSAFRDGFFATGDIGEWTSNGHLRITDRKKDLIKTAGGKYVAPQKLEGLLQKSPLVSHAVIHGDQRKYVVALLTLEASERDRLAKDHGLSEMKSEDLVKAEPVVNAVRQVIAQTNSNLSSFETIKNFAILPYDFSVQSGELTPSLKVKRKVLEKRHSDLIESLY